MAKRVVLSKPQDATASARVMLQSSTMTAPEPSGEGAGHDDIRFIAEFAVHHSHRYFADGREEI